MDKASLSYNDKESYEDVKFFTEDKGYSPEDIAAIKALQPGQKYDVSGGNHTIECVETIDCTPTWQGMLKMFLAVIEDGNAEGRKVARKELLNMAKAADGYNEMIKAMKPVILWVQWGETESKKAEEDGIDKETATKYEFDSTELADAFLKGIDQAQGWLGYYSEIEQVN